ncbi:hypothetical protein IBZ12_21315 [Serratia ureilytica]|uniref:hypothetical protein n=1 Tax=Serratia ureilytica TaxID=300181 RepID=UPI0039B65DE8
MDEKTTRSAAHTWNRNTRLTLLPGEPVYCLFEGGRKRGKAGRSWGIEVTVLPGSQLRWQPVAEQVARIPRLTWWGDALYLVVCGLMVDIAEGRYVTGWLSEDGQRWLCCTPLTRRQLRAHPGFPTFEFIEGGYSSAAHLAHESERQTCID